MKLDLNICVIAVVGLLSLTATALGEDAITAPATKTIGATTSAKMVPSLAVLNSGGATLANGKLTIKWRSMPPADGVGHTGQTWWPALPANILISSYRSRAVRPATFPQSGIRPDQSRLHPAGGEYR